MNTLQGHRQGTVAPNALGVGEWPSECVVELGDRAAKAVIRRWRQAQTSMNIEAKEQHRGRLVLRFCIRVLAKDFRVSLREQLHEWG